MKRGLKKSSDGFIVKIETDLPFQIRQKGFLAHVDFLKINALIARVIKIISKEFDDALEKSVGQDLITSGYSGVFTFPEGGLMEIRTRNKNLRVRAYFNSKERADDFKKAFQSALREVKRSLGLAEEDIKISE